VRISQVGDIMRQMERPVNIKITTWNINSIRLRIGLVVDFLAKCSPDIICFQETKCRDGEFPLGPLRQAGYPHILVNGQKGYHGVAIASRHPLGQQVRRDFCNKGDARHIGAVFDVCGRQIQLHNFYIPAGGDEPDPEINLKFAHKLAFLDEFHDWTQSDDLAKTETILVGDFNVAPYEHDVWSHKALLKVVSHTPVETDKLKAILADGGWIDALRRFTPMPDKLYTWWSYRSPDWAKADKGRRLDHIWLSTSLGENIDSMEIFKEARGWERPSDHAPVSVTLKF
jgi:exodeoxyribonuclease-3